MLRTVVRSTKHVHILEGRRFLLSVLPRLIGKLGQTDPALSLLPPPTLQTFVRQPRLWCSFTTTAECEVVHGWKEKLCYIALTNNTELPATSLCSLLLFSSSSVVLFPFAPLYSLFAFSSSLSSLVSSVPLSIFLARCLRSLSPPHFALSLLSQFDCFSVFSLRRPSLLPLVHCLSLTLFACRFGGGGVLVCGGIGVRVSACTFKTPLCVPSKTPAFFIHACGSKAYMETFSIHTHRSVLNVHTQQDNTRHHTHAQHTEPHTRTDPRQRTHTPVNTHTDIPQPSPGVGTVPHAGAPGDANHVIWKPWFACVRFVCCQFWDSATVSLLHASAVGCANSGSTVGLCSNLPYDVQVFLFHAVVGLQASPRFSAVGSLSPC